LAMDAVPIMRAWETLKERYRLENLLIDLANLSTYLNTSPNSIPRLITHQVP